MSNIVVTKPKIMGLQTHNINNAEFVNELENTYHALLISNYGPRCSLTLIRNAAESDFLTSSSCTLVRQLPFSHPCFKFINALITAQNNGHGVHGLYCGALCSGLLFRSLKIEEFVSHRVLSDTVEYIQQLLVEYLINKNDNYSFKIDIGKLNQVLCVVRNILNSKSYHTLSAQETEYIAVKTVESFLQTIPQGESRDFGRLLITSLEVQSPLSSRVISGILYREPDYTEDELYSRLKKYSSSLKIVIFTVPLSQDMDEKKLIDWSSKFPTRDRPNVASYLSNVLRKTFKAKNVQIIASQKFIDDGLKFDLERDGFLVLERLGTTNTDFLTHMAGCCPIADLSNVEALLDTQIGLISVVDVLTLGEKTYINLLPVTPHRNVTLALGGTSCHVLEYLKESVEACVTLLQRMAVDPSVVCGGGCFETYLAFYLAEVKQRKVSKLAEDLDTTTVRVGLVFDMYIETFLRLAILPTGGKSAKLLDYFIDTEYHHLWEISTSLEAIETSEVGSYPNIQNRCACKCIDKDKLPKTTTFIPFLSLKRSEINLEQLEGKTSSKDDVRGLTDSVVEFGPDCVLDSFAAKVNALQFAFNGFSELIRIGICMFD